MSGQYQLFRLLSPRISKQEKKKKGARRGKDLKSDGIIILKERGEERQEKNKTMSDCDFQKHGNEMVGKTAEAVSDKSNACCR